MGLRVFSNDNQVNLLTWTSLTPQREIQPDDIVVLTEDSTSGFHRGAGTQLYTTLSDIGPAGTMVLLPKERHSDVRASTRATVLSCYPKTFRDFAGVDQDSWLDPGFTLPALTTVYTDGSYKQVGCVRDHICKTTTSVSCAAMVGTMDHTTFSGIRIDFTQPIFFLL